MILGSLFQDGAVFQRDRVIPVWGRTLPGAAVKGVLGGNVTYSRAGKDGNFMLYFPAMSAGEGLELTVSAPEYPGETASVKDILCGEVWLASGQSNMEYTINSDYRADKSSEEEPLSRKQEREFKSEVSDTGKFRFFSVARCASSAAESSVEGSWREMDGANSGDCSAVAAWFGLELRKKYPGIPVGIIVSAWGGTIAEAWTSANALRLNPATAESVDFVINSHRLADNYMNANGAEFDLCKHPLVKPDDGNRGVEQGWADADFDDSAWGEMSVPGSWVKQNIAGAGAVWIRKTFVLPADWQNCELILHTGGIDKHDISYANGVEIGRTGKDLECQYYGEARNYPIPAALTSGGKVTLAVRAFSFCQDGSFMGDWKLIRVRDKAVMPISGEWKCAVEYDRGRVYPRRNEHFFGVAMPNTPGILFDGMIRPLIPYALRGVIWYQGESNADNHADYYETLRTMITDWRYRWMMPEMPFIMVQLAGYGVKKSFAADSEWAFLRESQRLLAAEQQQTFMATAIDLGEALDIHPQDKKSVGKRLAASTFYHVYGEKDVVCSGPSICGAHRLDDGKVKLDFFNASGMYIDADKEQSFYVSADGKNFVAADSAQVDGESVILASSKVDFIFEVRYAWADFPANTLFNGCGVAASSFRIGVEE